MSPTIEKVAVPAVFFRDLLGAAGDQEEIGRPDRAEGEGTITCFAVSKT
jgi:hypothetical protein